MKHLSPVLLCLGALWLVGCGEGPAPGRDAVVDSGADPGCPTDTGGETPTWAEFGAPFFLTWCQGCHASGSPQRYGAPASIVFDTRADVRAQRDLVRDSVLVRGSMPVGGGLGPAERAGLGALLCAL